MSLAALPERPLSVREQRAILRPLKLCTVTFSGPRPEDFDWVVSCFDNLHFKYSIHSIVLGIRKKPHPVSFSLEYCGGRWGAKLTFPTAREKTRMVKLAQKVKERKMKNEKEEIYSPSGLRCDIFPHPPRICGDGVLSRYPSSYALCLNRCCQSLESN